MSTIYIKTEDVSPGHVMITCERSGLPITRTTEHGMFCDSEECVCEQKSRELESSPEFDQVSIGWNRGDELNIFAYGSGGKSLFSR